MGGPEAKKGLKADLKELFGRYREAFPGNTELDFCRDWEDKVVELEFREIDPAVEDLEWDDYDSYSQEEMQLKYEEEFLPDYYREWSETPLPALLGKTPVQAATGSAGRLRLNEILLAMEQQPRNVRGPSEYLEGLREQLGVSHDLSTANARLYSKPELQKMIRLARDANLDAVRQADPVFFQDLPQMIDQVTELNTVLEEDAEALRNSRRSAEIQSTADHLLQVEGHASRIRHYLQAPSSETLALEHDKEAAREEYRVRSEIALLNTRFRRHENLSVKLDVTLREILMILPEEVLEAIGEVFDIDQANSRSLRKAIAGRYQSQDDLVAIRGKLKSREQEALQDLIDRGGWVKYRTFVRRYGEDKMDFWYWAQRFPRAVLSVLRYYLIAWVGEHPEHGKIVLIPSDLRRFVGHE
jgi:hypothetical protein